MASYLSTMWSHYNGRFSSNAIIDHSFIDCPKWELCGVGILGKLHNFIISFKCFVLPYSIGVILTLFNGTGLNVLIFQHRIWPFCEFKVWLIFYLWHRCTVCNEYHVAEKHVIQNIWLHWFIITIWGNLVELLFTIQWTLCCVQLVKISSVTWMRNYEALIPYTYQLLWPSVLKRQIFAQVMDSIDAIILCIEMCNLQT